MLTGTAMRAISRAGDWVVGRSVRVVGMARPGMRVPFDDERVWRATRLRPLAPIIRVI